ncbi:MAG: hypothetical protein Q8O98_00645 [bacterium]|nr:hypothetical protein [bacterium]
MDNKPKELYHGSAHRIEGPLRPVLLEQTPDHIHTKPAVFATERLDLAALFMFPTDTLHSIGFEQDIAYICIWGTREDAAQNDRKGFIYILPPETFEKIGKGYEWQSFVEVTPIELKSYEKSVPGMIECGVQVYFINNNAVFDKIVEDKTNRATILKNLISENQRLGLNIKIFK